MHAATSLRTLSFDLPWCTGGVISWIAWLHDCFEATNLLGPSVVEAELLLDVCSLRQPEQGRGVPHLEQLQEVGFGSLQEQCDFSQLTQP